MTTVLVVEDNPINWKIFQKILTKQGGLVAKHTEDVAEVMQLAEAGEVDIILMDIALCNSTYQGRPVDGIKITQMLKANPKTAKVPVILVTAHAVEGDRENLLNQSSADGFIPKPVIDHGDFLDKILAQLPKE